MFQASEFHARSGRRVRMGEDGTVMFDGANGYLSPQTAMDAEEFMQAKRDADLARWRWPVNPDFVVYKRAEAGVLVVDERDGNNWYYSPYDVNRAGLPYDAACAYWEAHPHRAWEDAQSGDIWQLTRARESEVCRVVEIGDELRFQILVPSGPLRSYRVDSDAITAGELIGRVVS